MQASKSGRRQLENSSVRPHRSRKQKPCDYCRRRKVCCVRDLEGNCVLCTKRGIKCTFASEPLVRHHPSLSMQRGGSANACDDPQNVGREDLSPISTAVPHRSTGEGQSRNSESAQYVGLSGDYDPSILDTREPRLVADRHGADWRSHEVRHDPVMPIYFTVGGKQSVNTKALVLTK